MMGLVRGVGAAVGLMMLGVVLCACAGPGAAGRDVGVARPLVLAHYMAWFAAPPRSEAWGWHWTMGSVDPGVMVGGKARVASHYTPMIGAYDSGDPAVLEYHLLTMKLAGIDGVIVDWYGPADHHDYAMIHRNTALLFEMAGRLGMRVCVCYEDRVVSQMVLDGVLRESERVARARADLEWLEREWFVLPHYARLAGKPLLLSFGFEGLREDEWAGVMAGRGDRVVYLSEHRRRAVAAGAFDWPVPGEYPASVERFEAGSGGDGVRAPVAFPRFHDYYGEAGVHASWGRIDDDGGRTWDGTLGRALRSGAAVVQIATWNDWGEGTMVEPSVEFGFRDLEVLLGVRGGRGVEGGADDLRLPLRLLALRRLSEERRPASRELDRVAGLLAARDVRAARRALARLESR
jgi:hypothetical protein